MIIKTAPKMLRPPAMLTVIDFSVFQKTEKEKLKVYNHKKKIKAQEREKLKRGECIKMKQIAYGIF